MGDADGTRPPQGCERLHRELAPFEQLAAERFVPRLVVPAGREEAKPGLARGDITHERGLFASDGSCIPLVHPPRVGSYAAAVMPS
jgi:hypothetical protein